ncbi:MAG: type I restriction endonuclease [Prolixibacteraceae bacterium]|jgi:type I restriction enzyme R subunit
MAFNENTRVKIPAILHLCRLGYTYLSLSDSTWEENTNIFTDVFFESVKKINDGIEDVELQKLLEDISLDLANEDLGKAFYKRLTATSGTKLIDFENIGNNSFHVVTELTYKNGDEEFRPDITLLINGMPLAFIEVKKPNNRQGILDERDRINRRFSKKKFRKFINISQLLVFTNNMEYDNESVEPIQGSFYSSTSYHKANFNCFREEDTFDLDNLLLPEHDEIENRILKDNNLSIIKYSPEFITNKKPGSPANRILTSLFQKDRLRFILQYSIAYVNADDGIQKHVMRYPQLFATNAIEKTFDAGIQKGIIWHTQGSGKTALAYYNVKYLTDYFHKKGVVPKFYFIVDRIDLMTQAKQEFAKRGLTVHSVNSKEEFIWDIKTQSAIHNHHGKPEITVVNIQKFSDDSEATRSTDYNTNIQRIYFLDEVHRSYSPKGFFLANLVNSDRNAKLIGLTGTPLLAEDRRSRDLFGDYIHKYYYNSSIADGYTLKLIREGIETNYKMQLEQTLKEIEVLKGNVEKKVIYAHHRFVEPMLEYIVRDFKASRIRFNDKSIGAMVVCDSSEQAKMLFELFQKKYSQTVQSSEIYEPGLDLAADRESNFLPQNTFTASLILHDTGTKQDRKDEVDDFKKGKIDFLFVYGMLITGFDAPRLKKLYIGRIVKDHNLLQMLTRVNRPYKEFHFGFVVDFADIRKEFDKANKAYYDELQQELGDEMEHYSNLFKSQDEIEAEIRDIQEKLFHFDLLNAELFSQQISLIQDKKRVLEIKKALENIRNLYNLIRLFGYDELLKKVDFRKLNELYNEVSRHLDMLNLKEALENGIDNLQLLNEALENVIFLFKKISEDELKLADELKNALQKTREALVGNFDKKDPEFVSLYDELYRIFKKNHLDEVTQEEMKQNMGALKKIYDSITELNRKNNLLKAKYHNDQKYARIHKRMVEQGAVSKRESDIHEVLTEIKTKTDEKVILNQKVLRNDNYFDGMVRFLIMDCFKKIKLGANTQQLDLDTAAFVKDCVVKEYMNEYNGVETW